ncbi:hypothetical protein SALBM311S_08407 [Streptomyces alboniger]
MVYVPEAGAADTPLEVRGHGPETGGFQGRGIAGDVKEPGGDTVAETGERRQVLHAAESMAGVLGVTWSCPVGYPVHGCEQAQRSTLRKRVFVLARVSARVQHVARDAQAN